MIIVRKRACGNVFFTKLRVRDTARQDPIDQIENKRDL